MSLSGTASSKIGCGEPIASTAAPVAGNGLLGAAAPGPSGRSGRAAICSTSVILPFSIRSRSDRPTASGGRCGPVAELEACSITVPRNATCCVSMSGT